MSALVVKRRRSVFVAASVPSSLELVGPPQYVRACASNYLLSVPVFPRTPDAASARWAPL